MMLFTSAWSPPSWRAMLPQKSSAATTETFAGAAVTTDPAEPNAAVSSTTPTRHRPRRITPPF